MIDSLIQTFKLLYYHCLRFTSLPYALLNTTVALHKTKLVPDVYSVILEYTGTSHIIFAFPLQCLRVLYLIGGRILPPAVCGRFLRAPERHEQELGRIDRAWAWCAIPFCVPSCLLSLLDSLFQTFFTIVWHCLVFWVQQACGISLFLFLYAVCSFVGWNWMDWGVLLCLLHIYCIALLFSQFLCGSLPTILHHFPTPFPIPSFCHHTTCHIYLHLPLPTILPYNLPSSASDCIADILVLYAF